MVGLVRVRADAETVTRLAQCVDEFNRTHAQTGSVLGSETNTDTQDPMQQHGSHSHMSVLVREFAESFSTEPRTLEDALAYLLSLQKQQVLQDATAAGTKFSLRPRLKYSAPPVFTHELFEVRWGDNTHAILPRIHILFLAEDPENFAMRVLAAHNTRAKAALQLKKNLFIESMPTDDLELPAQKSLEKMIELATLANTSPLHRRQRIGGDTNSASAENNAQGTGGNAGANSGGYNQSSSAASGSENAQFSAGLGEQEWDAEEEDDDERKEKPLERRRKLARMDTTPFLREVTQFHSKAMNRLIFNQMKSDTHYASIFEGIELPDGQAEGVSRSAPSLPDSPLHAIEEAKNELIKQSFLTKPQVIQALYHIRYECNKITDMHLFCTAVLKGKTIRLEDLQGMQTQTCSSIVSFLNDRWMASLKNGVANALQTVGKGWFNLNEENQDVYEVSKLKKFFNTVTFMMQDALRTMMQNSVEQYTAFFEQLCPTHVTVSGMNDVQVIFPRRAMKRGIAKLLLSMRSVERRIRHARVLNGESPDGFDAPVEQSDAYPSEYNEETGELTQAQFANTQDDMQDPAQLQNETFAPVQQNITLRDLLEVAVAPPMQPTPLLSVDIEYTPQEGVHTHIPLNRFVEVPLTLFDTALESCQEFLHLETQLMPKLFKVSRETQVNKTVSSVLAAVSSMNASGAQTGASGGNEGKDKGTESEEKGKNSSGSDEKSAKERRKQLPTNIYLVVLDPDDEFAKTRSERLKNALTCMIAPLEEYVLTFEPLNELLAIDANQYA